ncbi:GAF domain-containing sensor histidine kinase [Paenibacillus paeoniae]|uniref:histidine kinase n=1 Tax=Paenibacillus paeoniae TaxID=2292705 RepID=A0A371PP47_9BACL|nr:GAF domain-containing sensor histidine kinase [Paenibacillus paeoniae]REK77695.1 GAF domain-containing protein [Paenibacillus paeoniae]
MYEERTLHYKELLILKTIAETLNQNHDMKPMLQSTLEKLLELTGLKTGWIFLADDEPIYHHVADHNLPPALARNDKEPMRCEICFCLQLYWRDSLNQAVNIIECERLHNSVTQSLGDTNNLTHHATVPLTICGERFGLLNVGSPGKEHFSDEELALLEGVAYQIGTAVERTQLLEQKEKLAVDNIARYIVDYYNSTNEVTRHIWTINNLRELLLTVVLNIGTYFDWPTVAIAAHHGNRLTLRALYDSENARVLNEASPHAEEDYSDIIHQAFYKQSVCQSKDAPFSFAALQSSQNRFSIAIPLQKQEPLMRNEPLGVLLIGRESAIFSELEIKILTTLADHISLAMERIRLYDEWQDLLLSEERNRLALDLHDSVNQKLFSLSLTAQGIKELLKEENPLVVDGISDIQKLSQETLSEMRTLIWQLRPYSAEKGMLASLKEYASKIGIHVTLQMKDDVQFTEKVEKNLWRIGQEAINNVSKHARTNRAAIKIQSIEDQIQMSIIDHGCGFLLEQAETKLVTLGISSMNERAAQLNGSLKINSTEGKGTIVIVTVPRSREN